MAFIADGPRQISQLQRSGDTMETGYLKHLDPELYLNLTEDLDGVRKRIEAGELGPAFLRELFATHSVLFTPRAPSAGGSDATSQP